MPDKKDIIVVLSRFPFPLEKGDKLRAYHQVRELSKEFNIHLVSISDRKISDEHRKELDKYCVSIKIERINLLTKGYGILRALLTSTPFQTGYFYKASAKKYIKQLVESKNIKHIYCQLIRTTELVKNIHNITKTLDYMDALSTGIERRINLQPFYKKWLFISEAKRLRNYERLIFDYFENKTIISQQDRNLISHPERDEITAIPNGVDPIFFESKPSEPSFDFVFVGNMSYPPNIAAASFIAKKILPNISDSKLLLAGATPHHSLIKIAQNNSSIKVTGWIDDIRDAYTDGKIFLAPMMIGTGMQNKLLEAMALGIPCITTSLANNAINAENGREIIVADTEEEILSSCKQLRNNEELRNSIGKAGKEFIKQHFSWTKSTDKLINLINNSINSNAAK